MRNGPVLNPRKEAERAARDERLGRALRDNLRRRKDQARVQAGGTRGDADTSTTLSGERLSSKSSGHGGPAAD
jgi:hypothetical protein